MHAHGAKRQIHNEINITPLTDVFLVLLIIMMLLQTSATLRYAGQIRPPEVEGAENVQQSDQNCIIEVTGKGPGGEAELLSIDKQEIPFAVPMTEEVRGGIVEILKNKAMAAEKAKLLLRADKDTSSDAVMAIIETIQSAAGDETLSTSQRQFLGTVNISVESVARAAASAPEPAPAQDAAPAQNVAPATPAPAPGATP